MASASVGATGDRLPRRFPRAGARNNCGTLTVLVGALAMIASVLVIGATSAEAVAAPFGASTIVARGMTAPDATVAGPDGNIWFTSGGAVGRITPTGVVTMFTDTYVGPVDMTVGPDGNLWFTNTYNPWDFIGRITPTGVVTLFKDPNILRPGRIAAGADGNLWFVNNGNSIGRISTSGAFSSFPLPGNVGLNGITAGVDGNVWFSDYINDSIGRITPAGTVSTYTGTGLVDPGDLATDAGGNLWFVNNGSSIGRVNTGGVVSIFTGTGTERPKRLTAGPDGNVWFSNSPGDSIGRITPGGTFANFTGVGISAPRGIASGADGNLWFANLDNSSIGRITPTGVVANFIGTGLSLPDHITTGPDGNLWFTDQGNDRIGRITTGGVVATFSSGTGTKGKGGITTGPDGNVWFTNINTDSIGRITPAGVVTTFGHPSISRPRGITAGPDGNLWFANSGNGSIGRITPLGALTSFTGAGTTSPYDITAGADGNLWFTNFSPVPNGGWVGKITPTGVVSVVATPTFAPGASRVGAPMEITKGPDGNVWATYVNDSSPIRDQAIWRITPAGQLTVFGFFVPNDVASGPDGNVWFIDNGGIGRITPNGTVSLTNARAARLTAGPDGNVWFTNGTEIGYVGTIPGVPPAPIQITATAGDLQAVVEWSASRDGGSPITGFVVTATPGGASCSSSVAWSCTVTGLTAGVSYSFRVTASNALGTGPPSAPSNAVVPTTSSGFHPLVPTRVLDSRTPTGGWNGRLASGIPRTLQIAGPGGASNVPALAKAVVMNVTATGASADSFLSVWRGGTVPTVSSNLNFATGETIANLVTVELSAGGYASFANAWGSVDVIADLVGYYDNGTVPGDLFNGITPARVLDSRTPTGNWNGELAGKTPRDLLVRQPGNPAGVPATATAVIANLTATGASTGSFISVWPSGSTQPTSSSLNFAAGQTIANQVIVPIGSNDSIRLANAVGAVDVILDVVGYFDPTGGQRFHPITPTRVLDDRVNKGLAGPWGQNQTRALPLAGAADTKVPAGATGLVANVTATNGNKGSFVTVFSGGAARPNTSSLNFGGGQTIPNHVTVTLPANGAINLYNALGVVDLIADAAGYYAPT